jgi:hypothetical protein
MIEPRQARLPCADLEIKIALSVALRACLRRLKERDQQAP